MASYKDDLSVFGQKKNTTRPRPRLVGPSGDASELRARAARYRQLAEILFDPHVVAEVQACARELDIEASWVENQASFDPREVMPRYRTGN